MMRKAPLLSWAPNPISLTIALRYRKSLCAAKNRAISCSSIPSRSSTAGESQRAPESPSTDFVLEIRGNGRASGVSTASGKELPCDFVCIGAGIVPNIELAKEAGLEIDNGIVVDQYLQSSHPDIYAGGDVASYWDPLFGKRRRVEHWGHAEYCGQLAGQNMVGARKPYDLLTYVWSDIFDLHLEFAGDEGEHDQVLRRGLFEDASCMVLYLTL